jgi:hypothetical protein
LEFTDLLGQERHVLARGKANDLKAVWVSPDDIEGLPAD